MKIEVYFIGSSIDVDTFEGDSITWVLDSKQLSVFKSSKLVASYPESRVVRVRVV